MGKQKIEFETFKLVTDGGNVITINYPEDIQEEIWAEIQEHLELKQLWYVGNWCDANAVYKSHNLEHINMAKIIGIKY